MKIQEKSQNFLYFLYNKKQKAIVYGFFYLIA